jgi:glycosyltransferase A (GT-A) superfamily protein (DUF2064 family)
VHVCIIAKEPVAGRVKTRLCPPCSPEQAAAIADASLRDTISAVRATPAAARTICLAGRPRDLVPHDFSVVAQRPGGLALGLAGAFDDCFAATPNESVVLVGMDTPQLHPHQLRDAAERLASGEDAVLGVAEDGG